MLFLWNDCVNVLLIYGHKGYESYDRHTRKLCEI